jgi:hypothetical protein
LHFTFFVNKIWIYKAYVSVFVHIKEKIKDILLKLYNFLACAAEIFGKRAAKSTVSMLQKWDAPKNKSQLTSSSLRGGGLQAP